MKKLILLSLVALFTMNINTLSAKDKKSRQEIRTERKIRHKAERKAAQTEKMLKEEHKREERKEAQIRREATKNSTTSVEHHRDN